MQEIQRGRGRNININTFAIRNWLTWLWRDSKYPQDLQVVKASK
jgi:hypothetical protein